MPLTKKFPIIWKFGIHIAIAGLLMTSMVWISIISSHDLKGDALAMDMAGSERMRLLRIAFLVDRLVWVREDTVAEIKREVAVFEETLLALKYGREADGLISQTDRNVIYSIDENSKRWTNEIKPIIMLVLDTPDREPLKDVLETQGFKRRIFSFVEDINRMVRLMELDSSREVNTYINYQYLIFVFLLLVALSSFVFVHMVLTLPIRRLITVTSRIASGDLSTRAGVDTKDELGELAHSFNTMTEKLLESRKAFLDQSKLAALGELSAGIAHEIRNPLSSIKMNLMILFNKAVGEVQKGADHYPQRRQEDKKTREHFKVALREVDHLEKILKTLLDFAVTSELFLSNEDITDIIEASLHMAEAEINKKRIDIVRHYGKPILARIDASKVKQALLNIILNAVHALYEQGTITINVDEKDGELLIAVTDNGCGIDEKRLKRVFEPFFTTRPDGTGLGLPLTKKLIEEHHGHVDIQSAHGKGTTVSVRLRGI
ncbi:MAG: HAMP domain-containing protein [Deltaproteobacteria bacterium]|nr:HAMP domain-containing protein [Deltaproteobacteria bacterium]